MEEVLSRGYDGNTKLLTDSMLLKKSSEISLRSEESLDDEELDIGFENNEWKSDYEAIEHPYGGKKIINCCNEKL